MERIGPMPIFDPISGLSQLMMYKTPSWPPSRVEQSTLIIQTTGTSESTSVLLGHGTTRTSTYMRRKDTS